MTTDDRPYRGENATSDAHDSDEDRSPTRKPDLWDDLGLETDAELPQVRDTAVPEAETEGPTDDWTGEDPPDRGRIMAILAHLSVVFGVPVFLVPLVLRKDALSLHHAKAAAVIFFAFYATLSLAMFSSSLFLPVAMALYIPGLVGIRRAVRERSAGHLGLGSLAELVFPWPRPR